MSVPSFHLDQMQREWIAWRQVCLQLGRLGVDVNKENSLTLALKLWGEEMGQLRREQAQESEVKVIGWRDEARTEYEPEWLVEGPGVPNRRTSGGQIK